MAANFAAPQQELVRRFRAASNITVETSLGATGSLFAQIRNGAPFDVFLAADHERPQRLEEDGHAVPGTRFTYAIGRLIVYAPGWDAVSADALVRRAPSIRHLAIANPRTAPYGAAAREVLDQWDLWEDLEPRIIRGESVGQAFQFVESGAAEVGLVALAAVASRQTGPYWIVPQALHEPIRQDAVLLRNGERNEHARTFLEFLRSTEGRTVIERFRYAVP